MCCRVDQQLEAQKVKCTMISIANYTSTPDTWLHYKKNPTKDNQSVCIFQTMHVDAINQHVTVQTRVLKQELGKVSLNFEIVSRQSDKINQQVANYPFIVHNLGDQ